MTDIFSYLPFAEKLPQPAKDHKCDLCIQVFNERCEELDPQSSLYQSCSLFLKDSRSGPFLCRVFAFSPFLREIALAHLDIFFSLLEKGPTPVFQSLLAEMQDEMQDKTNRYETKAHIMKDLRLMRQKVALTVGLADILEIWPIMDCCKALSDFADQAIDTAISYLWRSLIQAGTSAIPQDANDGKQTNKPRGYTILALGKLGARELNYSSDIDVIALYDPKTIAYSGKGNLEDAINRLTRELITILQERTADGYVFRTDMRLRPDPGSMPLAVPLDMAITYYESAGQNWERAAMIKARPSAGDTALGNTFLKALTPYIWRKHLDFWAIRDIQSIKRQIYAAKGGSKIALEGHNIKLGRGGIREIEFFAQTQQLIYGGRDPSLRTRQTLVALERLVASQRIQEQTAAQLRESYLFLRRLEHRLQMVGDQQTHSIPTNEAELEEICHFMGYAERKDFADAVLSHLRRVEHHYAELFEEQPSLSEPGNLVFTGGEPDPETMKTLENLGYKDSEKVFNVVRTWHHGRYRATRTERARQILTELMPTLLTAFSKTRDPDKTLLRFDRFLQSLPGGVQLFALLYQNPALMELLAEIFGNAPALARYLKLKPALLDAVLDTVFFEPLPTQDILGEQLKDWGSRAGDFQDRLDLSRSWCHDHRFQIGVQLLRGLIDAGEAARGFSDLAEIVLGYLLSFVEVELQRSHGEIPGATFAVVALGRLGSHDLTFTSDLDLVFLYDAPAKAGWSDGAKSLDAQTYFGRLAQRFMTALSAPTAEGKLYEIDTRLRPYGKSGPLAIDIQAYDRYYRQEAWTWEHMALTRARAVAGDKKLLEKYETLRCDLMALPRDRAEVLSNAKAMREKIAKTYPGKDPWDLKYCKGGIYDLNFLAQSLQLIYAARYPNVIQRKTVGVFKALQDFGALSQQDTHTLLAARDLYQTLSHFLRVTLGESDTSGIFPLEMQKRLARITGHADFQDLNQTLERLESDVGAIYDVIFSESGDSNTILTYDKSG